MQTLVWVNGTGGDELDLRNFLGKDTELPYSKRFESPYVLFVPGYSNAPGHLRGAGRTKIEVTNEAAEELRTHPVFRFLEPAVADEVTRRAISRFVEERPELAEARQFEADRIGPVIEVAPTAAIPVTIPKSAVPPATPPAEGEGEKK